MAETRRRVTVELSTRDIQEAVAAWLNSQPPFADFWTPDEIVVSAEMVWRGHGMGEMKVPVPTVKAVSK